MRPTPRADRDLTPPAAGSPLPFRARAGVVFAATLAAAIPLAAAATHTAPALESARRAAAATAVAPGAMGPVPSPLAADPAPREAIPLEVAVDRVPALSMVATALDASVLLPPPGGPDPVAGACPPEISTHTDAPFSGGGSFVLQAGFSTGEVAAASYTLPSSAFPLKIDSTEMIFGTQGASVTTTTQWSLLVWEGTPSNGTLVAEFSSDDVILPNIVLPPGNNAINVQVIVDPDDPDQIIVTDNGSSTFSIGYRIDQHNQPSSNPCLVAPPATQNAFPATDTSGLAASSGNWLFGLNCGFLGCPPNGGWSTFAGLNILCRPSGDWVMRATWTSLNCSGAAGACCLPDGTCTILEEADCVSQGGQYQGDNVLCGTIPCPDPLGACCLGTECSVGTQAECDLVGGTFLGVGTDCSDPDACNPEGACCIPSTGGCLVLPQDDCSLVDGVFQGAFTTCDGLVCFPIGACCLPDGSCIDGIAPEDCDALGGSFQGDGTNCGGVSCPLPTGACCLQDGAACLELTEDDCGIVAGVWAGPGTDCADDDGDGTADDCGTCPGDFDGSGDVAFADLLQVLGAWGPCSGCVEDLDDSGAVDFPDLLQILGSFGDC